MSGRPKAGLVGGFLGSGKTTLLRHVLSAPRLPERTAVLVNEVGEMGIDGAILKKLSGGVLELANGCICCQLSSDFVEGVKRIVAEQRPERLLIESTGIAEPGKVLLQLYGPLADVVRVEPTVIVVDASAFDRLYEDVAYHYVMQIKSAEVILLNKTDLVTKPRLKAVRAKVAELNPRAFIVETEHCAVDLWGLLEGRPSPPPKGGGGQSGGLRSNSFISHSFSNLGRLDSKKLDKFLSKLPRTMFRVKGFVDLPEGPKLLNWVCGQLEWEPWPDFKKDGGESRLVFIGSDVKTDTIRKALQRCHP